MNPHQQAVAQLERVADLLEADYEDKTRFRAAIKKLSQPDQVHETELSVKMDDGSTKKFKAFRSQHSNARGPYKGGVRYHQMVTKEEIMAFSTWMTWKCSVTGIPYGGGKGGVVVNPRELSEGELERLSRAYARFVAPFVGPWMDVPAPDVNTTPQIMAWFIDEHEKFLLEQGGRIEENVLATYTGKPLELRGSAGREEATGLGGAFVLDKLAKKMGKKSLTLAVQGFGNVGYWLAYHADQMGHKVVAVSDSKGAIYEPKGLKPEKVLAEKKKTGKLSGGKALSNEELLELDVDVVAPAALEGVINKDNADKIKAMAVLELANGPTTPEADEILANQGTIVVPDVLANAGGVTVSYFEWAQNLQGYYWTRDEVVQKLQPLMEDAFEKMWVMKEKHDIDGRMATYMNAVKQVIDVMLLKGQV